MSILTLAPKDSHFRDLILPEYCWVGDWIASVVEYDDVSLKDLFRNFDKEGYLLTEYEKLSYAKSKIPMQYYMGAYTATYPWFTQSEGQENSEVYIDHSLRLYRFGLSDDAKDHLRYYITQCRPVANLINLVPKFGLDLQIDYTDDEGNVAEVFHLERDYRDVNIFEESMMLWEYVLMDIDWEFVAKQVASHKSKYAHLSGMEQANWKISYVLNKEMRSEVNLRTIL